MKKQIIVRLQLEGVHCWPECDVEGVEFLKHPHRHIFFIECKKEISHNDRDIEIIKLKRSIQDYMTKKYAINDITCEFGRKSCEDLAEEILNAFDLNYCSVLEDNENGAEVISSS